MRLMGSETVSDNLFDSSGADWPCHRVSHRKAGHDSASGRHELDPYGYTEPLQNPRRFNWSNTVHPA